MVQTAVADPVGRLGQIVQGPWPQDIRSAVCEGALAAGSLVDYGTDAERQVQEIPALPAVDIDAIMTAAAFASAAAAQSLDAGNFDGAIGFDRISPARTISVDFDANAGWDTPSGECRVDIYGHDALGAAIKDTVSRPNSGAVAVGVDTRLAFASVEHVDIEACNAATGTATMGVSNDRVELSTADYPGLAAYESIKEPNTAAREFADEEDVAILHRGMMISVPEHAVSIGDDVYVRVLEAGADLRGQLTGSDGAATPATYAKLPGARWASAVAADGFAKVEMRG